MEKLRLILIHTVKIRANPPTKGMFLVFMAVCIRTMINNKNILAKDLEQLLLS